MKIIMGSITVTTIEGSSPQGAPLALQSFYRVQGNAALLHSPFIL